MTQVKITIIDDRFREQLEDECPFKGPRDVRVPVDEFHHVLYTRCNVNQTSTPVCVGLDHVNCALREYNSFRVEIPGMLKVDERWRKKS
jgi:hypothetical protein